MQTHSLPYLVSCPKSRDAIASKSQSIEGSFSILGGGQRIFQILKYKKRYIQIVQLTCSQTMPQIFLCLVLHSFFFDDYIIIREISHFSILCIFFCLIKRKCTIVNYGQYFNIKIFFISLPELQLTISDRIRANFHPFT